MKQYVSPEITVHSVESENTCQMWKGSPGPPPPPPGQHPDDPQQDRPFWHDGPWGPDDPGKPKSW